ncbi:hypothetical protein BH18ACT15_BH18ACT15_14130 [soil metagenome]
MIARDLPRGQDGNRLARRLFAGLPARYDLLAEVLSFGQNGRWRRALVDRIVQAGPQTVLDVATGTCGVALQIAHRTESRITALDLSEPMIREGARRVSRSGYGPRINLLAGRGERLPFRDGEFDALTFTYLLRYVDDPAATLNELTRVLRPGGVMASLEFFVPPNPFLRAAWAFYARALIPLGGLLGGGRDWWRVGRFLYPNIMEHYRRHPLAWHLDAWREAGMENVEAHTMSLGGGLVMWGVKRRG